MSISNLYKSINDDLKNIFVNNLSCAGIFKSNVITDQNNNVLLTPTSVNSGTIIASNAVRSASFTDLSGNPISTGGDDKKFLVNNTFTQSSENADVDIGDALTGTITTAATSVGAFQSDVFKVIGSKITANNLVLLSLVDTTSDMNGNTGHGLPFITTGVLNGYGNGQASGQFYIRIGNADNASINSKTFTIRFLIIE